jgi:hypothetical protein
MAPGTGQTAHQSNVQGWPNVLRVSCAALIERDDYQAEISFQNRHDLGPRSGVSCTRVLGGNSGIPHLYQLWPRVYRRATRNNIVTTTLIGPTTNHSGWCGATGQTRTVLSRPAEASWRPSGLNASR